MVAEVQIGLLGLFELRVAGRQVLVRSANYRIVLAALSAEPGRMVSAAELIDAIWGVSQPDHPRQAMHVCVARVRAMLASAGVPDIIVSGTDGYRLDVSPESVDVVQFRRWMDQADAAARRDDAAGETLALTEAGRLWRGEPFADVPSDLLHHAYAVQLVELRMRAVERRIDHQLTTGVDAAVVAELAELTTKYPLHERLWLQFLTALYQSGRRADALHTYHVLRLHLADELGIEPGEELQQLHARILAGPGGDGGAAVALPVVPRQLPMDVSGFAGRAAEMDRMSELLVERESGAINGSAVLVVTGMAGVGKTTLAVHWSRRVADRFPDGQLWLDLHGYDRHAPATPEQTLVTVLRALGVQTETIPTDLEGQVGLYRSLIDGRRILVVLDNASRFEQVMPLLPGEAQAFVVVTSRDDLAPLVAAEGARVICLNPFTPDEAHQMLRPRLGVTRISTEPDAAAQIIRDCDGLPLALAIVAARAVARPNFSLQAMERQLADVARPLDRFRSPKAELDVRAVFSWSYRSLSPDSARLFRTLALYPTADLSIAAAACLVDMPVSHARLLLDELSAAHLVTEHIPDRYTVHDLLHAYAGELGAVHDSAAQRSTDLRHVLEWLTGTALNARPLLQPSESGVALPAKPRTVAPLSFNDERTASEWYEAERNSLVIGVELAYAHGFDHVCWRLAYATWVYLHLTSAWDDLLRTHESGLRAAERADDLIGQAQMLAGMGTAYRSTGNTAGAITAQRAALATFRAGGDASGTANALSNLCAAYRDAGDYDEALKCGERAIALDEALDKPANIAISLLQIAMTLTAAGRPDDAIPSISRALELFRKIGHRRAEARGLQLAATAHMQLGQYDLAVEQYQTAIDIYQHLADRWHEAAVLTALGDALCQCQRPQQSRAAWGRALAIYDELGATPTAELREKLRSPVERG